MLASIWDYLRDMITFRVRAVFWDIIDSSAIESFKETLNRSWEFFKNLITFKIGATTRETFDSSTGKSFKETVATGSKVGSQKAFNISRKYVSLAQARAQAGTKATRRAIITGRQQLPGTLRRRFFAGLQVLIPVVATILILVWFFSKIDGILQPIISLIFGRTIPGLGFGITVLLILIAGIVVSNVVGRKVYGYGESALSRVPIVRHIYYGIKQVLESFSSQGKGKFMQVVLVEFPKKGMQTIGFITNEATDSSGRLRLNVFIPTAPNPTSGFLQIIADEDVIRTDISIDDALKMILSAGRVSAKEITEKLSEKTPGVAELESILEAQMDDKDPDRILQ